jgi:hypothetical protein
MFEGTAVRDLDGNGSARYFLAIGGTVLFGGVFLAIGGTAIGLTDWEVWAPGAKGKRQKACEQGYVFH